MLCLRHKCQLWKSLAEHELQPYKVTCKNYQHTNEHFSFPSFTRFKFRERLIYLAVLVVEFVYLKVFVLHFEKTIIS